MKKNKENRTAVEMVWFYLHRMICALILLFLITPVLVIVPLSFSESAFLVYPVQGFSLRWYENFFSSPTWMLGLKNTLIVAPLATLIAMVLGTLAALGFNRANFFGKAFLMSLLVSPMVVPVVIVGVAAYLFFAPLGMANNIWLLILMHAVLGVPFVVITVLATLEGFDQNLVKAASSLGASPVYAFFRVTLPIIAPGVISGGLFAFGISFDEVVLTLFVAGPDQFTLPRVMFSGIRENLNPTIAAAATLLIIFSVVMLLTLEWLRRRSEKMRLGLANGD
ncbi:polyamine ABC transporter permease [Advenella faeciporci]|uniref:Polyamine ABC transporter permease n=1 Tax=Advenella faeciporci TaxID=797535 RepID=A0A918MY15_9BURK|nr:ABC transporter permease [Advenella faeciporci]GGW84201.1 polyamine ABC transporter permease [Advenella faeciporci]